MNSFIEKYYDQFTKVDTFSLKNNRNYFESLYLKFCDANEKELIIHEPEAGIESNIIPLPILEKSHYPLIQEYRDLNEDESVLKNFELVLCKMHAGLGTSVDRIASLKEITGRENLGSKGTDLFLQINGEFKSIAELQLVQAKILHNQQSFKNVHLQNLVNEETINEVSQFKNELVKPEILQMMAPTVFNGELTDERVAPAGHAFVGFSLLDAIFNGDEAADELIVIGNGEDLNSTPDNQILAWVANNNIAVTMITTTKLSKDKKGGQISVVVGEKNYVTIVEKAQAEKSNQLDYFESLGLRPGDKKSLFNTNIVVINTKALKEKLDKLHLTSSEFHKIITPDLIKNKKEQDGKEFIQLEGAIGSTMLNLDKYFRLNVGEPILSFLNLDPKSRENFFIPIKQMEDFNELIEKYTYNPRTGRLDLRK